ncbi:TPA: autotransporter outer membrane beta-barrel domain-containing protein, partial [Salmonella enterica subsp. enterica serovar Infantis]|nr:autotransporter outer membrane beta-barrel domain-containing protein [Salmonella enterica subsp. enterica serovar Infantis]
MHSWKKKLVVSQLALACTLAITSQANATTYDTFGYHDDAATVFGWDNTNDHDYLTYGGYVYNTPASDSGYFDTKFTGDTVNGVISTFYLNHDYANDTANTLDVTNSTIHGMITSYQIGYGQYVWTNGSDYTTHDWVDDDTFNLNISNSTIDDDFEAFYFTDTYLDSDGKTVKTDYDKLVTAGLGTAITLDVESNINITNNSHVAGIALYQKDLGNSTYTTEAHQWDNTINVANSTVTSGSWSEDEEQGHFGNSSEPSDYNGNGWNKDDVALAFVDDPYSNYRMVNNVTFTDSQLLGDVVLQSSWNYNFYSDGRLVDDSTTVYTNGGWADDDQNVDHLTLTLNNTKWVGAAFNDSQSMDPVQFYDVDANSLDPDSTNYDAWGRVNSAASFQSGIFDV